MRPKLKALVARRRRVLTRLPTLSAAEVLELVWAMRGAHAHPIGCQCSGVSDETGLSCQELWAAVQSRSKASA